MNNTKMSWLAKTYVLIKSIDPFHATVGAVNCANSWSFADGAASYLTPTVSLSDRVIPVGNCTDLASSDCKQPIQQLSLDIIMQENYNQNLDGHTGMGTFDQGLGCCGWYRHGAAREVFVNSPGSDYAGFTSHWLTPRFIYTDLWLGV